MPATFLVDVPNVGIYKSSIRAQAALTANTNGVAVDLIEAEGPVALLVFAGDIDTSSADETYVVKLQESATSGGTYTDITGASVAITADNAEGAVATGLRTKRFVRAVLTVGGTTPSFLGVAAVLTRKKISGSGNGAQVTG